MTQVGLDNKIDKVPKVPEIIVTSSTNTLALKGLEVSSSAQNQVVTIDPLTGVLNRSSFLSTKMLLIIEQLKGSFVYNAQSHYHT
jgi:GGDEF domain-containing protein